MLSAIEQMLLLHGVAVTLRAAPAQAPFDASLDVQPGPTTPDAFTTLGAPRLGVDEGLADTYDILVTVSHTRRTVDGKTLGLTPGFNFDQARCTLDGIAYQVVKAHPRYHSGSIAGWDLGLNR